MEIFLNKNPCECEGTSKPPAELPRGKRVADSAADCALYIVAPFEWQTRALSLLMFSSEFAFESHINKRNF